MHEVAAEDEGEYTANNSFGIDDMPRIDKEGGGYKL